MILLKLEHICSIIILRLFFPLIFISWGLIILQYCSGFCRTLTWISHGFKCVPHPDPPSHLPFHPIPLGLPSAPAPSTLVHWEDKHLRLFIYEFMEWSFRIIQLKIVFQKCWFPFGKTLRSACKHYWYTSILFERVNVL